MKFYHLLTFVAAFSYGVNAAVFPPSRFPFKDKMDTKDIPQMITITFDDSLQHAKFATIKKYVLDIQDKRGCPPRITHFTSFDWTQCEPVKFMYDTGAVEQGHHTGMHTGTPTVAQIKSAMDQLEGCGVPRSEITGFRTPFLAYNETTLVNLKSLNVIYDTTLIQDDDVASGYGVNNTWPFTLENGFTGSIKCGVTGSCINQSYPNMWEIPMYRWYDSSNRLLNDIMDYPSFTTDVQQMFDRHYNGNRAPFGIYLHEPWLNKNGAALKQWIEKIMATYNDVHFVTNMDLLEWMQNPVPKSQYVPKACKSRAEMFGCLPPAPGYKCDGYGQFFDFATCKCSCMQNFCPINGGPSNGGACTDWNCPTTPVAPIPVAAPVPSPPVAPSAPVAPVTPTPPVPAPIWNYTLDPMTDYKKNLGYPLQYPFERLFSVEETPQFAIITIDDGVSDSRVKPTADYLMSIQKMDSRGCTPKITMFVSFDYTMCGLLYELYKAKHEMATHTLSHEGYPSKAQIDGGFKSQVACGTPANEVIGFRTPYLTYDQRVLDDLYALQGEYKRTLYDSSVVVDAFGPTDYGRKNFWPWKWDHAQKVTYNRATPYATPSPHIEWKNFDPVKASNMKGMWEIPMPLYFEPGKDVNYYQNMDYPFSHEIMWDNFYRRYNGNRSPFHINIHAPWLEKNGASLKLWIEELLTKHDDVFFITNKQLLEYMENPVPLSVYKQQRICDAPGYDDSYCFPKNYACNWWSEDWDNESCACTCKAGFCRRDGTCTDWNCPVPTAPVAPVAPVTPPSAPAPVRAPSPVTVPTAPVTVPTAPVTVPTAPVAAPEAPIPAPVAPPVYSGPGCCSNDFKTCITWCGTTEAQCNACGVSDPKIWLADGALTNNNCAPRWNGYGCTSHDICCPGLACLANSDGVSRSCLPGDRSAPVPAPPVAPPVQSPSTAIAVWGQCGTTPSGGNFGVNCTNSYCAWGNEHWQSCQPCSRAPLNAFDCQNYQLKCGSTSAFAVCAKRRTLRGVNESN